MSSLDPILLNLFFLLAGALLIWLLSKARYRKSIDDLKAAELELTGTHSAKSLMEEELSRIRIELKDAQKEMRRLETSLHVRESQYENLKERHAQDVEKSAEDRHLFKKELELLSNRIFEDKGGKLIEDNKKSLDAILNPFKDRILEFQQKVEEAQIKRKEDHGSLLTQLRMLSETHEQLSHDAQNLTTALRSDVKTQGNWGEMVLEKVLQSSELREGEEYVKQYATNNEEGKKVMPDFVVNLPQNRHIVIDSKVSLKDYERFISADDELERSSAIKGHVLSVKKHIRSLSDKRYQNADGLISPDFVLMFIPIEASFAVTLKEEKDIFTFAWDRKVVLVSPSTLLATLRTVASLWQQERQERNVQEIAKKAGALYDKFNGFVQDLQGIGSHLSKAEASYASAFKKLSTGKGNILGRVEKLQELGAATKGGQRIDIQAIEKEIERIDERID